MLGEPRELVPFFAADDASGAVAPSASGSPEQNGQTRSRRAKKPPADAAAAAAAAPPPQQPPLAAAAQPTGAKAAKKVATPAKAAKAKKAPPAPPPSASPKQTTPAKTGPAFAGGAFEKSPHPSSLPKPRFSGQSSPSQTSPAAGPMDTTHATHALRSLLGVPVELPATARQPAAAPDAFSLGAAAAGAPNASQQLCSMLGVRAC